MTSGLITASDSATRGALPYRDSGGCEATYLHTGPRGRPGFQFSLRDRKVWNNKAKHQHDRQTVIIFFFPLQQNGGVEPGLGLTHTVN